MQVFHAGRWMEDDARATMVASESRSLAAQRASTKNILWVNAESKGNYLLIDDDATKRIFPKDRNGKSLMVTIRKHVLTLKHKHSGDEVLFSRNQARGRWYYHDSRVKEAVSRFDIVRSIQRMLKVSLGDAGVIVRDRLAE